MRNQPPNPFQLEPEKRPKETIIVTSIFFALLHLQYGLWSWHCAGAFFGGIGFGVVRLATGSIGLCIVLHGAWDIVVFAAGGDPRASSAFAVAVTAALLFHPKCRPIAEPMAPAFDGANTGRPKNRPMNTNRRTLPNN